MHHSRSTSGPGGFGLVDAERLDAVGSPGLVRHIHLRKGLADIGLEKGPVDHHNRQQMDLAGFRSRLLKGPTGRGFVLLGPTVGYHIETSSWRVGTEV